MPKRKQSEQVYDHINTITREMGTTRDGSTLRARTNARSLESVVEPETVTSHAHYEYTPKGGQMIVERNDIVKNAQRSTARLTMAGPPVTGNLRMERQRRDADAVMKDKGFGSGFENPCCGMEPDSDWGRPGSPAPSVPLTGGMRRRRSY